ncbi:MAG: energy-coupling factor transporter ATPase [Firmicutes bacterium]|nr:energy-coupling factor transporter ATPase [Bacillota bacterium]
MIRIIDLEHEYKKDNNESIKTLKKINIDIKKGDFVSIIGHNGSGKSTLAKHLNGLIIPQKGEVIIDDIKVNEDNNIWEIRRKVGMVFQNPDNQFVGGTIEEDIAFGLENIGYPSKDMMDRIKYAAGKVGMGDYLKRPPHKLSGGQKQRSAIGSVLAMEPDYLVLDEPTSMLDPKGRKEVIEVLRELNKKDNMTIVLITHFMDEVVYSDKVIVMDQGNIVLQGTPEEVFHNRGLLKNINLELPKAAILQEILAEKGIILKDEVLTKEDLVEAIWQLF